MRIAAMAAVALLSRTGAAQSLPAAVSLRLGAECAAVPRGAVLALEPGLVLGLEREGLSAELRVPARARLGSGPPCFVLGDVEAECSARLQRGEALIRAGARLAAPTGTPGGGALPTGASAILPSGWEAALSLERAAILDPAAMAAKVEVGLLLPRRGEKARPRLMLGTGASLAEALNARIALGLSAWLAAWLPLGRESIPSAPGGPERAAGALFGGGASVRALWRGEGIELSAGLSAGFGAEAEGTALYLGLIFACASGRDAAAP